LRIKNSYSFKRPFDRILRLQQGVDEITQTLVSVSKHTLELERERLIGLVNRLDSASPLKVLSRGYSMTTSLESNKPIKSIEGLTIGKKLKIRFFKGIVISSVVELLE
jgi:exodeoxyribonuclease VII large subunit